MLYDTAIYLPKKNNIADCKNVLLSWIDQLRRYAFKNYLKGHKGQQRSLKNTPGLGRRLRIISEIGPNSRTQTVSLLISYCQEVFSVVS